MKTYLVIELGGTDIAQKILAGSPEEAVQKYVPTPKPEEPASVEPKDNPDKFMSVTEIAEFLCVSKAYIYRQAQEKKIPHVKIGKSLRFRKTDIDTWVGSLGDKDWMK